jgi:hypothetical protein
MGETKGDNFKRGIAFLLSYGVIFLTVTGPVTLLVSRLDFRLDLRMLTCVISAGRGHFEIRLCKKSSGIDSRRRPLFPDLDRLAGSSLLWQDGLIGILKLLPLSLVSLLCPCKLAL